MQKTFFIVLGVIVLGLVAFGIYAGNKPAKVGKLDEFAKCINDSGAKFYGAFWCPHCNDQKELFGTSAKLLPYVECSQASGSGQLPVCIDKKIEGYPTWIYPKEISFTSKDKPIVCEANDSKPECAKRTSTFLKSWLFSDMTVQSATDGKEVNGVWTFPAESRVGATPLNRFAEITSCKLPE